MSLRLYNIACRMSCWITNSAQRRKKVSGVKVSWAYALAEVQVRTTADGDNWDQAVGWHQLNRNHVSLEEDMTFDRPQNVKSLKIEMRGQRPWSYFGINQATFVVAS
mmetsp:Transcript_68225/g.222001  ORF Transcript_68225/g.222001 Transcript_68225/m.222001 type:complete len:107 (-) Transcript_68225:89-409(-)